MFNERQFMGKKIIYRKVIQTLSSLSFMLVIVGRKQFKFIVQ